MTARGPSRARGWWHWRPWVVALVVCTGLAALFAAGVWAHPGTRWLGYTGDPQQTTWFLRWTPWAVGHGINPLLTDHIGYPQGVNLMWNTAVVLVGLVLAPVTLTLGPVVAYNVAVVLAFALSGFACWAALRRVCGVPAEAALAGALFYEFSPYTTAHALGQLNMTAALAPPLVLLLAHEVLVRRRWSVRRAGLLLGLVAVGQAFVSEEMLASTGIACLVFVVVLALAGGWPFADVRDAAWRGLRALGWALAAFVPLMAAPLAVQFGGAQALHGAVQRPGVFVTDLANLVVPTQAQLLAPGAAVDFSQRFSGNPVEWAGYLGVPLLAVVVWVAVRCWGDRRVRVAAICAAVFAVLSLGPSLHVGGHDTGVPLPWAVVEHVPLLRDMLPGRMAVYTDLCVAVLVAIAVARVAALASPLVRRRAVLGLAAVGVTVLPAMPLPSDTVPLPAFFTSAAAGRLPWQGSVLVVPFSADFTSAEPMVWQAQAGMGFRMPEGYAMIPDAAGRTWVGPPPSALSRVLRGIAAGRRAPALDGGERMALIADLRAWEVRAAVVGPMPHRADAVALLAGLFGCAPVPVEGVDVWWRVGADGCG
jgi:hypothetical protein